MELNLENFNIRNSKPIILGNAGLPKNTERYHLNGMGIIGIDIYKDDKIKIINIEGSQVCEITFFDKIWKLTLMMPLPIFIFLLKEKIKKTKKMKLFYLSH